ncbi:chromosome segregation ATPase [Enterococcus sp. PF1-24]|uniref:hypothetical protein n=1 Tax=unclassified Enterococcus TaxID=2608891 RepID=UPI0024766222|nr:MULTISPECIES: hypothetical protein [unclassified Enterococcus]MDH6364888.1 chromosome segregation ATPase [Enterococcus sp. PFB1-1]MDH6401989.1 chromosome segregation ATPase [Enterococcus sp. PF1-24]
MSKKESSQQNQTKKNVIHLDLKNGGDASMATKTFSNPNESAEWLASMEQENRYLTRQIIQLEEEKKRLQGELKRPSQAAQSAGNLAYPEQVNQSLSVLEEKSARLEQQLLTAKNFIDKLSEAAANDEQIIRENQTLQNQLVTTQSALSDEKVQQHLLQEQITTLEEAITLMKRQSASKVEREDLEELQARTHDLENDITRLTTERNRLSVQLLDAQEQEKILSTDAGKKQETIQKISQALELAQLELAEEKAKHIVDPKTSPEYVALLEENISLRSRNPKDSADYLELLTEKNKYEQKYKAYNPKASKEYLELLVITERQRAQLAEMIASQEMIRITQDEIADILSEAQRKARRIIEHSEERASDIIKDAERKAQRMRTSLNHYNEDLQAMVTTSVDVFSKLAEQADGLDQDFEL